MRCPQCYHENRDGAKFCSACGMKLDLSCPSCGTVNEPGATFCDNCGATLKTKAKGKKQSSVRRPGSRVQKTADSGPRTADARHQTPDARPVSYTPRHLAERILAERDAMAARGAPEGERKSITAL